MKLKYILNLIVCLIFINIELKGQIYYHNINSTSTLIAESFIDNYNRKDYKAIKESLMYIANLIVSNHTIEEQFSPIYLTYGQLSIDSITQSSQTVIWVHVHSKFDTSEALHIKLEIDKRNKITSIYFREPEFIFSAGTIKSETMLNAFVNNKVRESLFSGSIVAVSKGETILNLCSGNTSLNSGSPITDLTLFDLASCSKFLTAICIMMLWERGQLDISDDVQNFYPDLPYKGVTIRNLLNHTSGMPDYMELLYEKWDKTKIATNDDVINMLIQYKPSRHFKPGSYFEYSNTGYVLLASIIEKITNASYSDFVFKNLFEPLNMSYSKVGLSLNETNHNEEVANGVIYDFENHKFKEIMNVSEYSYIKYLSGIVGDGNIYILIRLIFLN